MYKIAFILLIFTVGMMIYDRVMINIKHRNSISMTNNLTNMHPRKFEEYIANLFQKTGDYKNVELTNYTNDGGKDIILTDFNDDKIFVEVKRYTTDATNTEEYMIGRVICQKLIGAMVQNGIKKGLIVTTGNVHENAWSFIRDLENNQDEYKLDIITRPQLIKMINDLNKKDNSIFDSIAKFN